MGIFLTKTTLETMSSLLGTVLLKWEGVLNLLWSTSQHSKNSWLLKVHN